MSNPHEPQEKKIIIDEDWKSQVQAEKEELERKQRERAEQPRPSEQREAGETAAGPLPPPSFSMLITGLGVEAMAALGFTPSPLTGKTEVHLDHARHLIDMLQMLQEKTEGNRTEEETSVLDNLLHQLRMGYVARVQQAH